MSIIGIWNNLENNNIFFLKNNNYLYIKYLLPTLLTRR